jgi:glycosyltransferase involved in cell wall biosynthesis
MPYRVGLNALLLSLTESYRGAGINGYIYQLLRHLPAADRELAYQAFLYDPTFQPPAEVSGYRSDWDTRSPWQRILWEQTRLAALTRRLDLLHGLAFASPLVAACPTIVTVHDLSFIRFPEAFRPFHRLYLHWITSLSTRRARRVIAVSESTRRDVIQFFGVRAGRVVTVPNGVTAEFSPANADQVADFRRRRGLPDRFMLFLGTLEPRKNLVRLIDAYADWRRTGSASVKLVLAGGQGWYYEQIYARVVERGLGDDVFFPGYVPGAELPWWYRAAELFVYPSLFEGFGLPVLEAMACGTPVITSSSSSLPEVAGDSTLLVDPSDTAALTAAMTQVLTDQDRAADLRARGLQQAAGFSWSRTAEATVQVYRAVLEARNEA